MRKLVQPPALAALVIILLAPPASAAITASTIDSPANPHYFYAEQGSARVVLHVEGTATGTGNIDLNCYRANGAHGTLVPSVPVAGGTFVVDVKASEAYLAVSDPCVLRAVPAGDGTARPPSATSDPFQGPTLVESWSSDSVTVTDHRLSDFDYTSNMLGGTVDVHSASGGAINSSNLFAPGSLAPSEVLFEGNGYFNGGSLIKVDGTDAFLPSSASGPIPGWGPLRYTQSFDTTTGGVSITSQEPAATCNGCTVFAPAGVELDRTVTTSDNGHVITMMDRWRSTDGASHALDATYVQGFHTSNAGGSFFFPGTSGFQDYAPNATVALPHGAGTVYVKEDHTTPAVGDGSHPQGAVSYASAPDSSAVFTQVSTNYSEWDAHYVRTVPATGALVLRFSYAQQYALADVQALAQSATDSFAPSVAITTPADGTNTVSPNVTVTGTAADGLGITSVKVNGQNATVAGDGSWQAALVLTPGANHVTAVATNVDGITAERQITVTYTKPSIQQPPPPQPALSLLGHPSAVNNGVSFRVTCAGSACTGAATLTATEIVRRSDGKVIGVTARKRPPTRKKTITVGQTAFTLQAGGTQTMTVRLSPAGRKLLARFGRLPVRLSIALIRGGGKPTTIAARAVTIKTKPR